MKALKVERMGETVQGIRLKGNPKDPEPESVRIVFPGGDIDLVRCDDGSYWVHVRVDSDEDVKTSDRAKRVGRVVDVRVDYRDHHHEAESHVESQLSPVDFGTPGPYHLAVRVGSVS